MQKPWVVVVSGLSGAGKSTALRYFEDFGFFCVDNLPPTLLPTFIELCAQSAEITRVAVGVDVREREFFPEFLDVYGQLNGSGYRIELLFLEAQPEVLIHRFHETRRPHPLAKERSVLEGIRLEQEQLAKLRERAGRILDTSSFTARQLKDTLMVYYTDHGHDRKVALVLTSFGYKYGVPYEADLLLDVRFLKNPHVHPDLRPLPGTDSQVQRYVMQQEEAKLFLDKTLEFLCGVIPLMEQDGRPSLTICVGCTGGRHRSVAVVVALTDLLQRRGYPVSVRHRDLEV